MNYADSVIIKGKKDRISIFLDDQIDFALIKKELEKKSKDSKKFFEGTSTAVSFDGRDLSLEQEKELIGILKNSAGMEVPFVYFDKFDKQIEDSYIRKHIDSVKELIPDIGKTDDVVTVDERISEIIDRDISTVKFHRGSIRSGSVLDYDGSIVLIGDVNPGGVLNATKNIIVLGTLKGQVHAGMNGDLDAFVVALEMIPTQLRIAHIITRIPDELKTRSTKEPKYAFVKDDNIAIVPLI